MKHQFLKLTFLISVCFIFTNWLQAQYMAPVRTMSIPATVDKIVFDGLDNESSYSEAQSLSVFNPTGYSGPNDFSGYFKVCWDKRFLYFFANITDDKEHCFPNTTNGDTWMYDNIEIYLDLDTSGKESFYTDRTIELRYNRGWNRVMWPGRAMAGDYFCHLKNKADSTGWVLETAIPWTCVLPSGSLPEDINEYFDKAIGFDVCFSDSDGNNPYAGMRDVMTAWDSDEPDNSLDRTEDNAWNNRKVFGIINFLGNPLPAPIDTPPPLPNDPLPPPNVPPIITDSVIPPQQPTEIINYIQPVETMNIPATIDSINFDGIDNESSYSPAQKLTTFYSYGDGTDADFSGYFKACWDNTYLYFFARITDDIDHSNLNGGNDWEFDNVEVLLDLDTNSAGTYYDENSIQIRLNRGWQRVSNAGRASADNFYYYSANTPSNDGWVVETAIPWICALPSGSEPEDIMEYIGNSIGFEVMGADSDGDDPYTGARESQSSWDRDEPDNTFDRTEDNAWNNTRVFGIVQFLGNPIVSPPPPPPAPPAPVPEPQPDPVNPPASGDNFIQPIMSMHIPQATDSMIIDGIGNESSYSSAQEMYPFSFSNYYGTPEDLSGYFKVCWDYHYLYFFADITDDINHSVLEDMNAWMFDNIELYLDLAIDEEQTAYDDNAIQIRFNRGIDSVIWPGRAEKNEYIYFWKNKPDNTGWIVEVAVPWTAALPEGKISEDISEYIYNNMGFDVTFSDSDGDDPTIGMRDIAIAWDMDEPNSLDDRTEDNAWNNTHVFGVVNLFDEDFLPEYNFEFVDTKPTEVNDAIKAFPNPTSGQVYFVNLEQVYSIEIMNLMGQVIKTIEVTQKQLSLDLTEFGSAGIYYVRIQLKDGRNLTQKIVFK